MPTIDSQTTRGRGLLRLIRFTEFDTSTTEGRARERTRRAWLTSLSAALARMVMMATPLVSIPLVLGLLGPERYGMWMTIASTISMLAFADLGMGNGVVSKIAHAHGREDHDNAVGYVSSAFFMLSGIALLALMILAISYRLIPWGQLFNVKSPSAIAESGRVMAIYVVGFAVSLPLGLVQKVQAGYQEGFQSNLWQCANSLLALGLVIAIVHAKGSLSSLILAIVGSQVFILSANCVFFYGRSKPWLRPRWTHFDAKKARLLFRVGLGFSLTSGLAAIGLYSDNLIATQRLGAEGVTQLAVPARMAAFLTAIPQMLYLPFWGANAEALARGENDWVWQNMLRTIRLSLVLTGFAALIFVLAGPPFIHYWIGGDVAASVSLMLALALTAAAISVAGPGFMVLNAAGVIHPQVVIYGIFMVVCIAIKIWWAGKWGVTGIAWATALCYPVFVLAPLYHLVSRTIARSRPLDREDKAAHLFTFKEAGK